VDGIVTSMKSIDEAARKLGLPSAEDLYHIILKTWEWRELNDIALIVPLILKDIKGKGNPKIVAGIVSRILEIYRCSI
jgi:hypothetical protein